MRTLIYIAIFIGLLGLDDDSHLKPSMHVNNNDRLPEVFTLPDKMGEQTFIDIYNCSESEVVMYAADYKKSDAILKLKYADDRLILDTLYVSRKSYYYSFDRHYFSLNSYPDENILTQEYNYVINLDSQTIHKTKPSVVYDIIDLRNDLFCVISYDNRDTNIKSRDSRNFPLVYSIYRNSHSIVSGRLIPEISDRSEYKGSFANNNYWGIFTQKVLYGKGVIKVQVYRNDGKYIGEQILEEGQLFANKKKDKCIIQNKGNLSIWVLNEKGRFINSAQIDIGSDQLIDYDFGNEEIFAITMASDNFFLSKWSIKDRENKNNTISVHRLSIEPTSGIFLVNNSVILVSRSFYIKATEKEVAELEKIGVKESQANLFKAYMESQIGYCRIKFDDKGIGNRENYTIQHDRKYSIKNCHIIPCKFEKGELLISYNEREYEKLNKKGVEIRVGGFGFFFIEDKKLIWNNHLGEAKPIENIIEAIKYSTNYYFKNSKTLNLYGI